MKWIIENPYWTITIILFIDTMIIPLFRKSKTPFILGFLFSCIGKTVSPFSGPVNKELSDNYYYSKTKTDIRYSPMGNWFSLGNTKVNHADVNTFEVIDREFAQDKNHLYYKYDTIENEIDKESFRIKDYILFDKNRVYIAKDHLSYKKQDKINDANKLFIIKGADPKTFVYLDFNWAKDNKHHFYNYEPLTVDFETFDVLNNNFCRDKDTLYVIKQDGIDATSINPTTVKKINDSYIYDQEYIYDFEQWIDGQKVNQHFSFPYKDFSSVKVVEEKYLFIDEKVFYDNEEMTSIDFSSFEIMEATGYSKDKKQVYFLGKIIVDADPSTFSLFNYQLYAKDDKHVFWNGEIIENANATTFKQVGDDTFLYKDKNHKYRGGEIWKN